LPGTGLPQLLTDHLARLGPKSIRHPAKLRLKETPGRRVIQDTDARALDGAKAQHRADLMIEQRHVGIADGLREILGNEFRADRPVSPNALHHATKFARTILDEVDGVSVSPQGLLVDHEHALAWFELGTIQQKIVSARAPRMRDVFRLNCHR